MGSYLWQTMFKDLMSRRVNVIPSKPLQSEYHEESHMKEFLHESYNNYFGHPQEINHMQNERYVSIFVDKQIRNCFKDDTR